MRGLPGACLLAGVGLITLAVAALVEPQTGGGLVHAVALALEALCGISGGVAVLANRHATRMNLALSNRLVDELLGVPPRDWNALHLGLARKEEEEARERAAKRARDRRPPTS